MLMAAVKHSSANELSSPEVKYKYKEVKMNEDAKLF